MNRAARRFKLHRAAEVTSVILDEEPRYLISPANLVDDSLRLLSNRATRRAPKWHEKAKKAMLRGRKQSP